MKPPEIESMLARIGYKPNWSFKYDYAQEVIYASLTGPNSYDHSKNVNVDVPLSVPDGLTETEFPEWLLGRVYFIERHEAREFFTLDGDHIFDPHPEFGRLDFDRHRAVTITRSKIEDLLRQLQALESS